jgi:hypothetical protein
MNMRVHSSTQPSPAGWPTTRRYPRTLDDAFKGADYGCAIEAHRRDVRVLGRVGRWLLAGACVLTLIAWGL